MGLNQTIYVFDNREEFQKFCEAQKNLDQKLLENRNLKFTSEVDTPEVNDFVNEECENFRSLISDIIYSHHQFRNYLPLDEWMNEFYQTSEDEEYAEFNLSDLRHAVHNDSIFTETDNEYDKEQLEEITNLVEELYNIYGDNAFIVYNAF